MVEGQNHQHAANNDRVQFPFATTVPSGDYKSPSWHPANPRAQAECRSTLASALGIVFSGGGVAVYGEHYGHWHAKAQFWSCKGEAFFQCMLFVVWCFLPTTVHHRNLDLHHTIQLLISMLVCMNNGGACERMFFALILMKTILENLRHSRD